MLGNLGLDEKLHEPDDVNWFLDTNFLVDSSLWEVVHAMLEKDRLQGLLQLKAQSAKATFS